MYEYWLFWFYILAAICTGLEFLIFGNEFCSENACKLADGGGQAISCFFIALCCANQVKSMANAMPPRYGNDDDENSLWYEDEEDKYRPIEEYHSDEDDGDDEASWESYYEEEDDESEEEDPERNSYGSEGEYDEDGSGEYDDDSENDDDGDDDASDRPPSVDLLDDPSDRRTTNNEGNLGVGYDPNVEPVFDPSSDEAHVMGSTQQPSSEEDIRAMYGNQPRVGGDDGPMIT